MGTQTAIHQTDRVTARLADAHYGVVSRRELLALGLSSKEIAARVRRGLLIPLHRGVYALGHRRLTRDGIWLAAVLSAGPGAVLSHRDAATLHGLGHWSFGAVEVTSARRGVSNARIRLFERRPLAPEDVTTVERIPVTTVARTLVDLAGVLQRDRFARVLEEADRARVLDVGAVDAALARVHGRHGSGHAVLRAVLEEHARRGVQLTRSELEILFRRLVREQRLPPAALNARVEGEEVERCGGRHASSSSSTAGGSTTTALPSRATARRPTA